MKNRGYFKNVDSLLVALVSDDTYDREKIMHEHLIEFSKKLCAATGSSREYDSVPWDEELFAKCSIDGKVCLEAVQSVKIPQNLDQYKNKKEKR